MPSKNSDILSASFSKQHHRIHGYCMDSYTNNSDSPTVILVHGIGVSGRYFFPLANQLSRDFNVIVVDLPGSGKTVKPARALDIKELSSILKAFIVHQQIQNATLIGHSMGCQTISMLAAHYPALCNKQVLISPTINVHERSAPKQFLRLMQDTTREPLEVNTVIFSDYLRYGFFRYLHTQSFMINDAIETRANKCMQPVLIIRGSKDDIASHDWTNELAGAFPRARLHEISNHAHAVHFTAAETVAQACKEFMRND